MQLYELISKAVCKIVSPQLYVRLVLLVTARISLKNCVLYFKLPYCQDLNIYVGGLEDTWGYLKYRVTKERE